MGNYRVYKDAFLEQGGGIAMSKLSSKTPYLDIYDKASERDKYPLVQKWMKDDPLVFFKELRNHRPILVTPECTLVSNFTDIRDILQMPLIFTVDLYKPKMGAVDKSDGYLMAYDDDALHYREKSIMQGFLNRNDLPHVRDIIGTNAKKILQNAIGSIEIVNEYCRMVPAALVQDYFGLDGIDKEDLIRWSYWNQYDVFHNQPFDGNPRKETDKIIREHENCNTQLVAYIASLILRKSISVRIAKILSPLIKIFQIFKLSLMRLINIPPAPPKMDIVKRMLRSKFDKNVDFNISRIGINAGGLLIGSIETTSQAVAQTIQYFLKAPDLFDEARNQALKPDHADFDAMVWEALRFVPISPYMFRVATEDYSVAKGTQWETKIEAGTNVLLLTQSAMFDTYAYDDPDVFKANRNWYHNFNFGFASHECLGKYIGMVMIPEMVRQVLLLKDLKSVGAMDYTSRLNIPGPFPEAYQLRWFDKNKTTLRK